MKTNDKAIREFVAGGWNVGLAAAISDLAVAGWSAQQIAAQVPVIQKHCGNEAIRAAGLNGGPRASDLYDHMEKFGEAMAQRLMELRTDEVCTN